METSDIAKGAAARPRNGSVAIPTRPAATKKKAPRWKNCSGSRGWNGLTLHTGRLQDGADAGLTACRPTTTRRLRGQAASRIAQTVQSRFDSAIVLGEVTTSPE